MYKHHTDDCCLKEVIYGPWYSPYEALWPVLTTTFGMPTAPQWLNGLTDFTPAMSVTASPPHVLGGGHPRLNPLLCWPCWTPEMWCGLLLGPKSHARLLQGVEGSYVEAQLWPKLDLATRLPENGQGLGG
eukprot:TRINITY_DN67966_c1_g2_i5.p1 TRINITY_DN67966_c1_g2~~TRINITY_DN67966_c1_g2_i5.p1  ORF type:complete len:130 (-),score=8.84 TRINITY_DN67966_c1_g2_i5:35-424(-)